MTRFWSILRALLTLLLLAAGVGVYMLYDLVNGPTPSGLGRRAPLVRSLTLPSSRCFRMAFRGAQELPGEWAGRALDHPQVIEISLGDQEYMEPREDVTRALLQYSDVVAVSSYPYLFDSVVRGGGVPPDWFERA